MKRSLLLCLAIIAVRLLQAAPYHNAAVFQMKSGLSDNDVNVICQDSRGFIWAGTKSGMDCYEQDGIRQMLKERTSVWALCEVDGILYAGTDNGLLLFPLQEKQPLPFFEKTRYGVSISSRVTCLARASEVLLIGTWGQGVFLYNTREKTLEQYSVGIPYVSCATVSPDNNLYIGEAQGGIYRISPSQTRGAITPILKKKDIRSLHLSHNRIWYVSGSIVGCVDLARGIRTREFSCGREVFSIAAYPTRRLVLGCSDGLRTLHPETGALTPLELGTEGVNGAKMRVCHTFLDREGTLWVASRGNGMMALTEKDRQTDLWPLTRPCQKMSLEEPGDGSLLVRSDRGDMCIWPLDGKIHFRPSGNAASDKRGAGMNPAPEVVTASCRDSQGNLYEAVKNCIYKSRPQSSQKEYYSFYGFVLFLYCDRQDQIWIGTEGKGLWVWSGETFSQVSINGVNRDAMTAWSVLSDNENNLWIASDVGIAKMNPRTRKQICLLYNEQQNDAERFIPGAALMSPVHGLWFGKNNCLICIHPSERIVNEVRPKVSINGIRLWGSTAPLSIPGSGESLRLPYTSNSFTIDYSVQSYQNPECNLTAWKMTGIDKEENWNREHQASFTHLRPGRYTFSVRGRNNDGIEAAHPATLNIVITPPWWMSKPAKAVFLLLISGLLVLIFFSWRRIVRRHYAQRLRKAQENLLMGMVHEIRTPISIIRLALDRMDRENKSSNEDIKAIRENLDYMQETVNGILTYRRNNQKEASLNKQQVELNQLCSLLSERFRESARLRSCSLEFIPHPDPIYLLCDEEALKKVINNLLSNALKYTRSHIVIRTSLEGTNACIRVEDDGPGVKDAEKKKIFELFYKAEGDKVAQASGLGVGLAYCAQLVAAHGGSIGVDDAPSGGAAFWVRMKAESVAGSAGPAPSTPASEPSTDKSSKPVALIVDDNLSLLEMLRRELSEYYTVRTAKDGQEALVLIENEGADIIVSDVMMPVMDGVELCRAIKEQMDYSHIPFILLTAKTSIEAKTLGMESGADAYVEKPFSIAQLQHQMSNLLKLRDSLRKNLGDEGEVVPQELQGLNKYDRKFMEDINTAIEEQIKQESFSIDSLAETMCMSKTNFYRKFHSLTGESPNEYIKNYRLNRAARLIREGARINEAAYSVGFYSSSYFAKCFKAKFGVLPKDYK